jgi:F-type H+-transporting ATPase subunit delta
MSAITSRYARAFVDVVLAQKLDPAKVRQEVEDFAGIVRSSAELRNVLDNPAVPHPQKIRLLDSLVAQAGASHPVRNFLAILMEKRRLHQLPEIAAQIQAEINERLGIAEAEVISARELAADERGALESEIAKVTGKKVQASYRQDKSVLGGAVVKVGSTIFDGSVRGRLARIRQTLVQ